MTGTQELEQILLEELDFSGRPTLQTDADIPWPAGRPIPGVNAAISLQNGPIAYFSRFTEIDPDKIQDLHKKVWSQSKAPLLFVTLPQEIRIYNGYEKPAKPNEDFDTPTRLLQQLENLTNHLTAQREIKEKLVIANHYDRVYLETGAFWDSPEGQRITHKNRADQQLVKSMGKMRDLLRAQGLSNSVAYTLLGRSVFIRYLEDRGILTKEWVNHMTNGQVDSYRDALPSRSVTYQLFEQLSARFNGDLFPVTKDEQNVAEPHLEILNSFLARTDLETGQLSFWPFNFEFIPIELISNIYDTFIDDQRASGAYYTPLLLADFILEETMGAEVLQPDMTVLDPACGSGIFLVGAYRRLVQAWRQANGDPRPEDLGRILQHNIFGVDKHQEAVRIAAFSLYLEILNHLTNDQIREESFHFPSLRQKNLIAQDFFAKELDQIFGDRKFDRIVGNMPWGKGTLTEKAQKWLTEKKYEVGGKQPAPAFMLRVPEFCYANGEIALLVPAKSTIHITSDPHQKFRDRFFSDFEVTAVVNFAAVRKELFTGAISPAIAIFYTPNAPTFDRKLVYGVPKPSPLSKHLKAIVLDTTEIKYLDWAELLAHPELWKVALWGSHRDAALIERLKLNSTLKKQLEKMDWEEPREGFQIGESKNEDRDSLRNPIPDFLKDLPFLPTNDFEPYYINPSPLTPVDTDRVYLPGSEERFEAPTVLIHQTNCKAAYVDQSISFLASITGVRGKTGQESILKWLVCLINSPLSRYYQFLTSTRWAVERANPLHKEYLDMPFLLPDEDNPKFQQILYHFDRIVELLSQDHTQKALIDPKWEVDLQQHKEAINTLVYELHNLHPIEQQLIEDMREYGEGFFNWAKRTTRKPGGAKPVQQPPVSMLQTYAKVFAQTASSILRFKNQTLNATVYKNGAPLTVVSFEIVNLDNQQPVQVVTQPAAMRTKLRELDQLLLDQKTPSMYMRRHVRIYDGNQVALVRPSEQRFWTQSQARVDADAFIAELAS